MNRATPVIVVLMLVAFSHGQDVETPPPSSAPAPTAESGALDLLQIREQLDRVLTDAGLPDGRERDQAAARIDALAQRSNTYAQQTDSPRAKLEASNLELRSYNALAHDAYLNQQPDEGQVRNEQLRAAAEKTKSIPEPAAETVGDFWLLQADLLDLNNNADVTDAGERQVRAITLLEKFVSARQKSGDAVEHDDAARRIATDVRLSLLRLYDDRGQSAKVCATVRELQAQADATDDAELREQLNRWFGYCEILGRRFDAILPRTDEADAVWKSADHRGRPVLLHFWASWWPSSFASFERLTAVKDELDRRDVALVSIDLGPVPPSSKMQLAKQQAKATGRNYAAPAIPDVPGWVRCHPPDDGGDLQSLFRIRSLPRYVLLDADGRVLALGGSLAILDQLPPIDLVAPTAP